MLNLNVNVITAIAKRLAVLIMTYENMTNETKCFKMTADSSQ